MKNPHSGTRPSRSIIAIGAALLMVLSTMALAQLNQAGAQKVANPGTLNLSLDGGTIRIKTTEFDLTPNPFPQCSDFLDNDNDGLIDFPADPQCASPTDDAEILAGNQPKGEISITGTIDANGNVTIPTSGVVFPPVYIEGDPGLAPVVTVRIQPTQAGTGNLNPLTGVATVNIFVRIKLEGGSGLTSLGDSCFIGSTGSPLALQMTTETTSPPAPNTPITGQRYQAETGTATLVNNSFNVIGASGCGLLGAGNGPINDILGLPSAAGNNTAILEGRIVPPKTRGVNAVVTGGPFRSDTVEEISFDGSGSNAIDGPIVSYAWDFGDGTTATGPTATHTYAEPGFYTASLTVTDSVGDAHTRNIPIRSGVPGVPPTAVATITEPEPPAPAEGTRPFRIDVRADGSAGFDGPVTYLWDFGDGNTSTAKRPTHVYTSTSPAGPKNVTLTVTDIDGLTDTATIPVNVINRQPTASFTLNPEGGAPRFSTVQADASASSDPDGSPIASYLWDWGDGTTSTGVTASKVYTADGDYTVTLTVTDADGATATATAPFTVFSVNVPPIADAGPDQTGRRTGQTVVLDGSNSFDLNGDDITYQWTQVSGVPVTINNPTAVNPTFVIPPKPDFVYPHDIVIQLVATDEFGLASDPATVTISVDRTLPSIGSIQITNTSPTPCLREELVWSAPLTNPDQYPVTWSWTMTRDQGNYFAPAGTAPANSTTAGTFGPLNNATPKMRLAAVTRSAGFLGIGANGPRANVTMTATLGDGTVVTDSDSFTGNLTVNNCGTTPVVNTGEYQVVAPGQIVTLSGVGFPGSGAGTLGNWQWEQVGGEGVAFITSAQTTSFAAPLNTGELSFRLTAQQGTLTTKPGFTKVIVVPAPPVANAGPDQSGITVGQTVNLTGAGTSTNPNQTRTFAWTQIGGPSVTLSGANTISPSFTAPPGPATLTFRLTAGGTNTPLTTTDTVVINVVNSPPVANAGPDQSGTAGTQVTLNGTGSSDPDGQTLSYSWTQLTGPPVTLTGANTAQPTFTPSVGVRTFQLTVNDGQGGTATDTVTITTFAPPTPQFTATPAAGILPLNVAVDASSTFSVNGAISSYSWDFGNGQTATGVNASATYTTPGIYTITLTVVDQAGATASTTQTVQAFVPAVASFTATPTSGEAPLEVEVDASDSTSVDGTIVSYEWDFGNGDTATGVTASTTYTGNNQAYTITLTITDSNGDTDTTTRTILVGNQFPTAAFTATPTSGLDPLDVAVDASASSDIDGTIEEYEWDFGNGDTATGVTASTTYQDPGTYTITLTVTDDQGATATTTRTIQVDPNQAPVASFTVDPDGGVNPLNVDVDASGSTDDGQIVSYAWDFGNGDTATGVTASTTYTDPGTYEITLTVTDDKGVTGTATQEIEVGQNQAPTAALTLTPTSGLNPLTVEADASGSTDVDGTVELYTFSVSGTTLEGDPVNAGPFSQTDPSIEFLFSEPGTYDVTVVVADDKGVTDSATETVEVGENQAPVASFTVSPTSGLTPLQVSVDASASTDDGQIVSYAWDFGNGDTATGVTASTVYVTDGSYEVTLTVTDDKGVSSSTTQTVEVGLNQAPEADFTATPAFGDIPLLVNVDASASTDDGEIVSYEWDFGNGDTGTGVTASTTYTAAGTYTITLTVTDDKGVSATTTRNVTAQVPLSARDAVNVRFTGAVEYEYVGPTAGAELRIVRDAFGTLRVRGTENFPSLVSGTAEVRATLDRFLIFNAFTGTVRVRDQAAGLNATGDMFLTGLSTPTATSVRGVAQGNVGFGQNFTLNFTIDDRARAN